MPLENISIKTISSENDPLVEPLANFIYEEYKNLLNEIKLSEETSPEETLKEVIEAIENGREYLVALDTKEGNAIVGCIGYSVGSLEKMINGSMSDNEQKGIVFEQLRDRGIDISADNLKINNWLVKGRAYVDQVSYKGRPSRILCQFR